MIRLATFFAFFGSLCVYGDTLIEARRKNETLWRQKQDTQALEALVAVERLSGNPDRALQLIESCNRDCLGKVRASERKSWRLWACRKNAKLNLCKN